MSLEVAGYGVKITLTNNEIAKGTVNKATSHFLTLENVTLNDGTTVHSMDFPSSLIADLSVENIPVDLSGSRGGRKNKSKSANVNGSGISSPYTVDIKHTKSAFGNVATGSPISSAATTPKPRLLTRGKQSPANSTVYRNDGNITWDSDVSQILRSKAFDFSKSTADFDKEQALSEYSKNDNIDPKDRLVSSNKKVNYANDEMVLGGKKKETSSEPTVEAAKSLSDQDLSGATRERRISSIKRQSTISLDIKGYNLTFTNSKTPLPLATPIQLLEAERAAEKLKIAQSLLDENLSRGLLFTIVKILGGASRIDDTNHNLPPLVLLLIGNNKAGGRALSIGRQLVNHGVRVIGIVNVKPEEMETQVSTQLELFNLSSPSPSVASSLKDLNKLVKDIESPVELIIDGLQGYDSNLNNDLWGEELNSVKSLIEWSNSQSVTTLSLDIPSGIDANSGQVGEIEPIHAKFVVSLGLPVNGIHSCYYNGVVEKGEWTHYLVDIGLPAAIFKRGNLRKFERNWFAGASCVGLEIREVDT